MKNPPARFQFNANARKPRDDQVRRSLAHHLAAGDAEKERIVLRIPLFEVALVGGEALQ